MDPAMASAPLEPGPPPQTPYEKPRHPRAGTLTFVFLSSLLIDYAVRLEPNPAARYERQVRLYNEWSKLVNDAMS